jgi:hypothetical protein
MMMKIELIFLMLMASVVLAKATTGCNAKIDAAVCQQMTGSSLIPVQILLIEPPFSYPAKGDRTQDSIYSVMVEDSLSSHLISLKPQIDSLFTKYDLRSVAFPNQRISSPNISYDYAMNVEATPSAINQLAQESLVGRLAYLSLQAPIATTTVPVFSILATQFPFDTTLIGLVKVTATNGIYNPDSVVIARYGLKCHFGQFIVAIGSTNYDDVKEDFCLADPSEMFQSDIRFPQDTYVFLTGKAYQNLPSSCNPPCTSYVEVDSSYKTHEYRFQIGSSTLYMKVENAANLDSIKIRFDTVSFLTNSRVNQIPAMTNSKNVDLFFDRGFVNVNGVENGRITIYDVSGKKLLSQTLTKNARVALPAFVGARIFVFKVTVGAEEFVAKKCLVN